MNLIKRIITAITTIIGSLLGIIVLATINSMTHMELTGGQVVLYGLIAGIVLGIIGGYMLTYYIIKRARQIIFNKFAGTLSRFGFLRRI